MGGCPEVDPHSGPDGGGVVKLEGDLRIGEGGRIYCEFVGGNAANGEILEG